jgi:hypothetical protein
MGLWAAAIAATITAVLGWRSAVPIVPAVGPGRLEPPPAQLVWPADSLAAEARAVAAGDPFRLDRRPADVPYRTESTGAPAPPPPKPARPPLALAGIVGGPPWVALLAGVPGRAGNVVVHRGDVLGDLTIRAVGKDTVIVHGADTTWTLTLAHPWR